VSASTALQRPPATIDAPAATVQRSRAGVVLLAVVFVALVAVLARAPSFVSLGTEATMVNFFILLTMATMWNLLAGYAGIVSIGQQAFIGLGAYGVLILAQHGMSPIATIPIVAVACGVAALPIWLLLFRLRGGYFAIATWVVAVTCEQVIGQFSSLGGFTGTILPGLGGMSPSEFVHATYWSALAVATVSVAGTYALLRSRVGLVFAAIRDDEVGAASAGARVARARAMAFVVAACGCGAAGTLLTISQLNVQPDSVFSVSWSAQMIVVCVLGGLGTVEGPVVGAVVFFILEQTLAQQAAWYFIIIGSVAVVVAIWAPKGIWGLISAKVRLRLFPVGYSVRYRRRPDTEELPAADAGASV
jgi:branched-chain amino acid transport system permease protein